jgi:uncharacterized protein YjbI with pentapeptide repeats
MGHNSRTTMIMMKKMKRRLKLFIKKNLFYLSKQLPRTVGEGYRSTFNSPFRYAILLCIIVILILVIFDYHYFIREQEYNWIELIVGAHGLFVDVLIFALVVLAIDLVRERRKKINGNYELLKDLCFWDEKEGILRKSGILRQLSKLKAKIPPVRGLRLQGADLQNLKLNRAQFYGADLTGANLSNTEMNHASFIPVNESERHSHDGDSASRKTIPKTRLKGALLIKTELCDSLLNRIDFSDLNMERIKLSRSHMRDTIFNRAFLHFADFCDGDLRGAMFTEADLYRARFKRADLRGVIFSRGKNESWENGYCARCTHTHFEKARLHNAFLANVDLSYANLSNTVIVKARMNHANLSGANLNNAILADTDLHSADFFMATLNKADLSRANLKGAKHLTIEQLKEVKTLYQAALDDELIKAVIANNLGYLLKYPGKKTE